MKCVVTGGAGFIGANLVKRLLDDEHEVTVVDNLSTGRLENIQYEAMDNRLSFIRGDLCNLRLAQEAIEGAEVVFHQAALGSVPRSVAEPIRTVNNNIMSTLNSLIAARDVGCKRFVYASSASYYGNTKPDIKEETIPPSPANPYAASKVAAEMLVKAFAETYGLETISLRYFNVFGPMQIPDGPYAAVVPRFVNCALHNEPVEIYGDGEQTRDFTYVENIVNANLLAATTEHFKNGDSFNIGAGKITSILELYRIVCMVVGGDQPEPIWKDARTGDVRQNRANVNKAKLIGYEPSVDVEEGIRRTIEYARKHNI